MYYLFTTPTCPNCPRAKSLVQEKGLDAQLVDAGTPGGLDLARKYGIVQVPSLLETDDDGNEVDRMSGVDEISKQIV